ncbi:MAG: phosphoadenylyl-sulfate reductase [Firmicutes bacterium]|nr:phosphoadenylyl-sulfate reductase [Bacillota bacterium]
MSVPDTNAPLPAWLDGANAVLEPMTPQAVLAWAVDRHGERIALASAFGAEDMVLIDMLARLGRPFRLFYLDTDVLFPETYALVERVVERYGVRPERVRPLLTLDEQARQYGDALWAREPDRCCALRKVEPLGRALSGLEAWITGIRRDQTPQRRTARRLEWDGAHGLYKFNPLAPWRSQEVWDYIRANDVPYNPLHDAGYPSIGCTHCTRPVAPGEDPRAGRWSGFDKTECGLHVPLAGR